VDSEKNLGKPYGASPAQESEEATPGEVRPRLFPEMRRPKPNQEAITAALQAMQRLTMKMDSEVAAEEGSTEPSLSSSKICSSCGYRNREGNKFCGMCGLPVETAASESPASESPTSESSGFELPSFDLPVPEPAGFENDQRLFQLPRALREPEREGPPPQGAPEGAHHYHHHYHHHYFESGEGTVAAPRGNGPESAREADRLRIAAAAKGEPMSRSEAAVRRLTQEWVLACNTRQLDELLDLYAPDAVVVRSNLPLLRGAAAVREFFFSAIESGLGEVAVEPIRVEVVGDIAHEVGRYSALVPGTGGKRREERGKYLWVFAKQSSGDWKVVSECWSSDLTLTGGESDVPKAAIPAASKGLPRKG
jgi:uncharacterized protein (TIGR02246 family)